MVTSYGDESSIPQRITDEVADRLINKLLKEGKLIELRQGQYYRNDERIPPRRRRPELMTSIL